MEEDTYIAIGYLRTDLPTTPGIRSALRRMATKYGYDMPLIISAADAGWRSLLVANIRRLDAEAVFVPSPNHLFDYADLLPLVDIVSLDPLVTHSRTSITGERLASWIFESSPDHRNSWKEAPSSGARIPEG